MDRFKLNTDLRSPLSPRKHTILEGKGVVYKLISEAESNLEVALRMVKKNKKMKQLVVSLSAAIKAVKDIE